ncbi:SpoIIE family protein phosphatase [Lentzea sp. NPDC004782]|uniref:SpoIIE family protein phosphatase n=1 Tax=Lentzea sp. NPDC004782 TaxID=3154458 RepID=UPI0033A8EE59
MRTTEGDTGPQQLRSLVDDLAAVVWQADARTRRVTFVSRHAERMLGHPVRRWLDEPAFWTSIVHPQDRAEVERVRWSGEADEYELTYRVLDAGGDVLWLREKARVHRDEAGARQLLDGVLVDVTRDRADADRERFLGVLDRESQKLDDAEALMSLATRLLGEHLHVDRCAYARAEEDENHFVMSGDHATGLPPLPGRFAMREFGSGALRAMRAGEPWVVVDSADDPRLDEEDLAAYQVTGIRAVICLPLLRGGRFVAAMAVHQASRRQWTQDEIDLVSVVVNRCWESMQRAHADRALRDSEQRLRRLIDRSTDSIWVLDRELRFVEVNPAACALLGYRREELIGRNAADLVVLDEDQDRPELADQMTAVWTMRCSDGATVALELSVQLTPTGLQAIGRDVTERQRVEAQRELLLQREHEIASALQLSLLPRELPVLDRLDTSARYLSASTHAQIGGDWYEVLPIADTVVGFSVGDVVGKGPTAAAVMGQLRSALAGYLLDGHSPAAALERLDTFASRVNGAAGSTCACLTFDWATGQLCWAGAGHPPPVVAGDGDARLLAGGVGAVLGTRGRARYGEAGTVLVPGASIVLYTDGLVERRGTVLDAGLDRLVGVVRAEHRRGAAELADAVVDVLLADGQDDDAALVVARFLPPPLHRTAPAEAGQLSVLRRAVSDWTAMAGLSEDLAYDVLLAYGEAAANVVDHAYAGRSGTFDTHVTRVGTTVQVTVADHGTWRPEPEDPGHRGRGLHLIRTMADETDLDKGESGTTIRFGFSVAPATAPTGVPSPVVPVPADTVDLTAEDGAGDVLVLRLTGDLDAHTSGPLRDPLLGHVDGSADRRAIGLDLTGLGYLSSSGVALLLELAEHARGARRELETITLAGSAPDRVLALSGLRDVFGVRSPQPAP